MLVGVASPDYRCIYLVPAPRRLSHCRDRASSSLSLPCLVAPSLPLPATVPRRLSDCRRPCLVSPAAGDSLSRYGKKETYRRNRTSHRTGWLFGLCRLCTCSCYTSYVVIGCEDRPFRVHSVKPTDSLHQVKVELLQHILRLRITAFIYMQFSTVATSLALHTRAFLKSSRDLAPHLSSHSGPP